MDRTIHKGIRWSAARAYLDPARGRTNLTIWTQCLAERVLFEGRRAVGVACRLHGRAVSVRARREVIVASGAINSPQLLMLSGIGPAADLKAHGIPLVADRPGVGGNLTDHLEFYFQVASKEPITLFGSLGPVPKALIGAEWILRKTGLGATNHFESCGFIRSRPGVAWPDLQYHFLPAAISYNGKDLADQHGFQAHIGPMRSKSRGRITLNSADPQDRPAILFNYMSHPDDWTEMRAAVRLTREIFAQPAFDRYRGVEIQPGAEVTSDAAIDAFIKEARRERLPSLLDLPHGSRRRSGRGGGSRYPRHRGRGPAGGRQFHHADHHDRQSQRPDHHAGRESRRSHPWPADAAVLECALLPGRSLGDGAALGSAPARRGTRSREGFSPLPEGRSIEEVLELTWL